MNQAENPGKNSAALIVIVGVLLLPVLYVLSLGPAVMIVDRTGMGEDFAKIFYYPLIWLHENTPLAGPLEWYVSLWE
jgi:hypothetical protein